MAGVIGAVVCGLIFFGASIYVTFFMKKTTDYEDKEK